MKKILVFLGHPTNDSFSGRIADAYTEAARMAGHDVERVNVGSLAFDPVLHRGYKEIQQLEPDLLMMQEKIMWADHLVFIYPNWWCSMPALMKGMFDRMWLPGFAFNFDHKIGLRYEHLKGKTARVIIVIGTNSPLKTWWKFGDFTNEIAHGILGFAGIKASVTPFGPSERVSEEKRNTWLEVVKKLAQKGI
jgi:NAD(P)H dehydrogenase (quinone)